MPPIEINNKTYELCSQYTDAGLDWFVVKHEGYYLFFAKVQNMYIELLRIGPQQHEALRNLPIIPPSPRGLAPAF